MISAGIDVGTGSIKVVILDGDKVLAKVGRKPEGEEEIEIEKALDEAIAKAGISKNDINSLIATGAGAKNVKNAKEVMTDVSSAALGASRRVSGARTIIDVGSEQARAVKTDDTGKVMDFATNERCAAGSGAFIEAMARALGVSFEEFISKHFESSTDIPLNAQCVVFAEAEVVSLINSEATTADISRAINRSIAERASSMARRVGIEDKVVAIGGVALNKGFIDALGKYLEQEVIVADEPGFINAYGAAYKGQL